MLFAFDVAAELLPVYLLSTITIVLLLMRSGSSRDPRVARLERKLDLLLQQAGIEFNPAKDVEPQVLAALKAGNKIEAIRLHRERTGCGLKDSKEAVEDIQAQLGL